MLTERQRLILATIVDDYIRSAEPVGSRSISKRGDVGFSPATIRNEMSDLEELGFLEQPHTSAGRIPSHKGYRYYVDHLVPMASLAPSELEVLKSFFADKLNAAEEVTQQASSILSQLTNYTSILLGPEVFNTSLRHFGIFPLNEHKAVAIVVTNSGHVENKTVAIPPGVSMADLERMVNLLNHKLAGMPIYKLKSQIYHEVGIEMQRQVSHYEELMGVLDQALDSSLDTQRIFLSGTTNMLTQPEFKDLEKVKGILDLLEETATLTKMMSSATTPSGIHVLIGSENDHEAFANCSLITASFSAQGQALGTIGILGPTRMDYARVIGLLNILTNNITALLPKS